MRVLTYYHSMILFSLRQACLPVEDELDCSTHIVMTMLAIALGVKDEHSHSLIYTA